MRCQKAQDGVSLVLCGALECMRLRALRHTVLVCCRVCALYEDANALFDRTSFNVFQNIGRRGVLGQTLCAKKLHAHSRCVLLRSARDPADPCCLPKCSVRNLVTDIPY